MIKRKILLFKSIEKKLFMKIYYKYELLRQSKKRVTFSKCYDFFSITTLKENAKKIPLF